MALDYCQRVARPTDSVKRTQRDAQYRFLVEKYPAHEFVVDLEEARVLGFNVSEPESELDSLFDELRPHLEEVQQYIGFVPSAEVKS